MNQSIDPAVFVVAVGVALRILHVADQRVAPVAKPECSVGANFWIDWSEEIVCRSNQIVDAFAGHTGDVFIAIVDRECGESVHVDHAGVDQLVVIFFRELPRLKELISA